MLPRARIEPKTTDDKLALLGDRAWRGLDGVREIGGRVLRVALIAIAALAVIMIVADRAEQAAWRERAEARAREPIHVSPQAIEKMEAAAARWTHELADAPEQDEPAHEAPQRVRN